MKRFGILFNRNIAAARSKAAELAKYIRSRGFSVYTEPCGAKPGKNLKVAGKKEILGKCDMIFVFGGDGTILRVAREVGKRKIPILGINMGGLGFLTELRITDIFRAFDNIILGKFEVEERQRLRADVFEKGKLKRSYIALNEIVIQNGQIARIMGIKIHVGSEYLTDLLADGVIVATPTGSTAYSLSANGPIVFPDNSCFIITPICPHTFSNRPIVVSDKKDITISVTEGEVPVLTIDGQDIYRLKPGEKVKARKSSYPVFLLKTKEISYSQVLREKLGWKGICY